MHDYLSQVRLADLDLQHIDLQPLDASSWSLRLRLIGLLGCLSVCFGLPHTGLYQLNPSLLGAVYASGCIALALAVSLWPWARRWVGAPRDAATAGSSVDVAAHIAALLGHLSPGWRRALLLVGFLGLGATVLLALPREPQWQGSGYSGGWFLTVGLALCTGIIGGRWLIMQAEAARLRKAATAPVDWQWPPWFKWVTLTGLLLGAAYATFGQQLSGSETESFSMTGVGFSVGIGGAIWIARRFDEWEIEWRAGRRRR